MEGKISEKYAIWRSQIKDGDIVLFRGNSLLSRSIQWFDNAYYNHIGVAFWHCGRLMILDSNEFGVRPDFMSYRINKYIDFCFITPVATRAEVDYAMYHAFVKGEEKHGYDFKKILTIAGFKLLKKIIKKKLFEYEAGVPDRYICSEFVQYYESFIYADYKPFKNITPQDFIRYRTTNYLLCADTKKN